MAPRKRRWKKETVELWRERRIRGSGGGGDGGGGRRVRPSNPSRKILSSNPPRFTRARHRRSHVTTAPSHRAPMDT